MIRILFSSPVSYLSESSFHLGVVFSYFFYQTLNLYADDMYLIPVRCTSIVFVIQLCCASTDTIFVEYMPCDLSNEVNNVRKCDCDIVVCEIFCQIVLNVHDIQSHSFIFLSVALSSITKKIKPLIGFCQ